MDKEALLKTYQQYRVIIFPVLTAFASLILIALIIIPQLANLVSNNQAYDDILRQNEFLEVKASELQNIDEQDLKQKLDTSLMALPVGKDLTETMSLLQSIVSQSGFILTSLQFGSVANSGGNSNFSIRMEVSGSRTGLNTLLNNIESSYRPMRISSVDITSSAASDAFNGSISLVSYYSTIPKTVGKIDAPIPTLSVKEQELLETLAQSTSLVSSGISTDPATSVNLPPRGKSNPFD